MHELTNHILSLREGYISIGLATDYQNINECFAVGFSEDIESVFDLECSILNTDYFLLKEEGLNGDGRWNKTALFHFDSNCLDDIDFDDLGELIQDFHQWIYFDGKHYDAECPYGVETLFELPFFKRQLQKNAVNI